MAAPLELTCWQDVSNFFARAQHKLHEDFAMMENPMGAWGDYVTYNGAFPKGSGFSARVTLMGSKRPTQTRTWNRMVGLQPDCVSSCTPASNEQRMNAWDDKWYHVFETSDRSEVFCLTKMWADALNLPEQIQNIERNLLMFNRELLDDYYRTTYAAVARNKWLGVDNNAGFIRKNLWDFAHDANGDPDINYIVIDPSILPEDISLLTQDFLDFISMNAFYTNAWNYLGTNLMPIMIDSVTSLKLPKQDNNDRADYRFVDPEVLDRRLGYQRQYAGWGHRIDNFMLRYNWTLEDPAYPNGVLKRVYHWEDEALTAGCTVDVSPDYLGASFGVFIPYNPDVLTYQNWDPPKSVGKDARFEAVTHAYEGTWKWMNQVDEYTPANARKELGYWLSDIRKAARPKRYDLGHVILARMYDTPGVLKSCRPLSVTAGSYVNCGPSCPPFDHYPPPMVVREVCGTYSRGGCECTPCNDGNCVD